MEIVHFLSQDFRNGTNIFGSASNGLDDCFFFFFLFFFDDDIGWLEFKSK